MNGDLSPEEIDALRALADHGKTQLAEDARELLAEIEGKEAADAR